MIFGCEVILKIFCSMANCKAELNSQIMQHTHKVTFEPLQSAVEYVVYQLQFVAEKGGQHTGHVLCKSSGN